MSRLSELIEIESEFEIFSPYMRNFDPIKLDKFLAEEDGAIDLSYELLDALQDMSANLISFLRDGDLTFRTLGTIFSKLYEDTESLIVYLDDFCEKVRRLYPKNKNMKTLRKEYVGVLKEEVSAFKKRLTEKISDEFKEVANLYKSHN